MGYVYDFGSRKKYLDVVYHLLNLYLMFDIHNSIYYTFIKGIVLFIKCDIFKSCPARDSSGINPVRRSNEEKKKI
jgi:hypothetical protein